MIVGDGSGRVITIGYRFDSVEPGDGGGGLRQKAASAILQQGMCLAIKSSEDSSAIDGLGFT